MGCAMISPGIIRVTTTCACTNTSALSNTGFRSSGAFGVRLSFLALFRLGSATLAIQKRQKGQPHSTTLARLRGGLKVAKLSESRLAPRRHQHNSLSGAQRVVKRFMDVFHWMLR